MRFCLLATIIDIYAVCDLCGGVCGRWVTVRAQGLTLWLPAVFQECQESRPI